MQKLATPRQRQVLSNSERAGWAPKRSLLPPRISSSARLRLSSLLTVPRALPRATQSSFQMSKHQASRARNSGFVIGRILKAEGWRVAEAGP